jgi:hypothetical protein
MRHEQKHARRGSNARQASREKTEQNAHVDERTEQRKSSDSRKNVKWRKAGS